ncbi:Z1 domain-containing protein [Mucilaginibacter sp. CAU 1740]|uniref:Z1 domain-containing protein n=1 Tax=Mucilaginibacter sp. CAU 1740 TaxID=3140365 RepID=UPI00325B2526
MAWEHLSDIIKRRAERYKREQGFITVEQLNHQIDTHFASLKDNPDFDYEFEGADESRLAEWLGNIKLRLKSVIVTTNDPDSVIDEKEDYDRWIDKRETKIEWNYFKRYIHYLRSIERPVDVIQNTEKSTHAIIERLGDPKRKIEPLQKGLVLGSVQSGKTANFNGVINRAIDAGYDIIIVFSGIMEDLRVQTQKRINHDVIGLGDKGGQFNQDVGVGKIQKFGRDGIYQITSVTTGTADFRKSMVDNHFDFTNQRLLICKKNVSVLTNLIFWLKSSLPEGSARLSKSVLVVDDEADNASLNNLGYKGAEYASKVNGHIRALLNLFSRRSYLGYTATPFANILQDQHGERAMDGAWPIKYRYQGEVRELDCTLSPGLFPDKFIYKLATPSSYLGPRRFFSTGREQEGDQKIPLIETIPDFPDDEDHIFGDDETVLRRSLTDAVDCFILSVALRDSRKSVLEILPGYTPHHTMLVHISRLISDQNIAAERLTKYVAHLDKKLKDDSIKDPNGIYEKLRLQWNKFFAFKVANIRSYLPEEYNADGLIPKTWDDISELLPNAVKNIQVKAVNSFTKDKLVYPDSETKKYIAVGGNRLSRGFTLEGLTINYFLRDTNLYDTLLQMGRWFGYRPGYLDACRLFIDAATEDKYNFITAALCELEEQIDNMEIQKKSPKEFELRIRKHPDILQITRAAILKNAVEVRYSFQDMVQQSVHFDFKKDGLQNAWDGFKKLFKETPFSTVEDDGFYTYDGSKDDLFRFLDLPSVFLDKSFLKDDMMHYIDMCAEGGMLTNWKIAVRRTGTGRSFSDDGIEITNLTRRSAPKKEESLYYSELKNKLLFTASGKSMNIMTSGSDESLGLGNEACEKAIDEFRAHKKKKLIASGKSEAEAEDTSQKITIPGWIFRKIRPENQGLLLIYLMDLRYVFNNDELRAVAVAKGIDINIPLIGYALSFPEIDNDPGAVYMANEYIRPEEPEIRNEDNEIPEDINDTEVNDIN